MQTISFTARVSVPIERALDGTFMASLRELCADVEVLSPAAVQGSPGGAKALSGASLQAYVAEWAKTSPAPAPIHEIARAVIRMGYTGHASFPGLVSSTGVACSILRARGEIGWYGKGIYGPPPGRPYATRTRRRKAAAPAADKANRLTIGDYVVAALAGGKAMSVSDIVTKMRDLGYQGTPQRIRKSLSPRLWQLKQEGRIVRVGNGIYQLA